MELIPLVLSEVQKIPTGMYLFLSPARPCKIGKYVGSACAWAMAEGAVAIGMLSEKGGNVPKVIRIDENTRPGDFAGIGIGFLVLTPYGETSSLEQLVAWAREH